MQGRMGKKYKIDRDSDSKFGPDQVVIKELRISTECWVNSLKNIKVETDDSFSKLGSRD